MYVLNNKEIMMEIYVHLIATESEMIVKLFAKDILTKEVARLPILAHQKEPKPKEMILKDSVQATAQSIALKILEKSCVQLMNPHWVASPEHSVILVQWILKENSVLHTPFVKNNVMLRKCFAQMESIQEVARMLTCVYQEEKIVMEIYVLSSAHQFVLKENISAKDY